MPRFSICVSTYNDAEYLPGCIDSVLAQSFTDFELIIVVDGSTDNSAAIVQEYAKSDCRIVPVIKDKNEGVHLGRATGVELSQGDYIFLLDSDDELESDALFQLDAALNEQPVDVLHFGIRVVPVGVDENECRDFETYINRDIEFLTGDDIVEAAYSQQAGYRQDWRITQRVYETNYFKRAYDCMTRDRLGRAQDGYECFVALSLAASQATRNDIVALKYYYGRGLNAGSRLSVDSFMKSVNGFWDAIIHIDNFASGREVSRECVDGARVKLLQLLFNDWLKRVSDSNKIEAAKNAAEVIGSLNVALELMRCSRDEAYARWVGGGRYISDAPYNVWYQAARDIAGVEASSSSEFLKLRSVTKGHIEDLRARTIKESYAEQDIRIFVSTHKRVDLFDSVLLQPVQVGCAVRPAEARFAWALHDDEGENISNQNAMYCELTTQYWAWKNVDADYIGFCHYRRYFDFNPKRHQENIYGEIMDERLDAETQREYFLDDAAIRSAVSDFDVVTTEVKDIRSFAGQNATIRSQYDDAAQLYVEDIDRMVDILGRQQPDYLDDALAFLSGHNSCFCNMFIMKRDIFREYCSWLFPILEEFVETTDMSRYSREGVRTPGHLAERLLNIYLFHHERFGTPWKRKQVQCVHFLDPDYHDELHMLQSEKDLRPVIPVVFAADNNYVPMLTTTIYSALKNASSKYRYDVVVMQRDITADNQSAMQAFFSQFPNATLRFANVSRTIENYQLTTNNPHISVETYYRFLVQELLPFYDKVLYLDSDLIVKGDISELFATDLGDNFVGAVRDIDFVGNVNMKKGKRFDYAKHVLGMNDPYDYFQAGVLVLNTRAMRGAHSMGEWLEFASDERYIYNDQDVLNAHCEGHVMFLDFSWNVMIDCGGRIGNIFSFAPATMYDAFLDSRSRERIVHYAGVEKPWKMTECDRAELYWKYARETPFYEKLLASLEREISTPQSIPVHARAISETNKLRGFVDPFMPVGSIRREATKAIARRIRGID